MFPTDQLCVYIYIYIEREREIPLENAGNKLQQFRIKLRIRKHGSLDLSASMFSEKFSNICTHLGATRLALYISATREPREMTIHCLQDDSFSVWSNTPITHHLVDGIITKSVPVNGGSEECHAILRL